LQRKERKEKGKTINTCKKNLKHQIQGFQKVVKTASEHLTTNAL